MFLDSDEMLHTPGNWFSLQLLDMSLSPDRYYNMICVMMTRVPFGESKNLCDGQDRALGWQADDLDSLEVSQLSEWLRASHFA